MGRYAFLTGLIVVGLNLSLVLVASGQSKYAEARFTSPQILIYGEGGTVEYNQDFVYNTTYGDSWRMVGYDAYVSLTFNVQMKPESAALTIRHLSSADPGCPGGGYSPVDIVLNGTTIAGNYDPAENHGGTHLFVTDEWDIAEHLQAGSNTVRISICGDACTHYWISHLLVDWVETREYTLRVTANPSNGGTVTLSPDRAKYSSGEQVTLIAVPAEGYEFSQWSGSISSSANPVTITMDSDKAITAGFEPGETKEPLIITLTAKYNGKFLAGIPVSNEYTAFVEWNEEPGVVEFYANDTLIASAAGTASGATGTFNMGADFPGAFGSSANRVRVRAKNGEGFFSDGYEKPVVVFPLPNAILNLVPWFSVQTTENEVHLAVDIDFPKPPFKQDITLPVFGKFGAEIAANASFDYTVTDGDWEAAFGLGAEGQKGKRGRRPLIPGITRYPKIKLYIGNKEISGHIKGGVTGTATITTGITLDEVFASAGISGKFELTRYSILDIIGPGITAALSTIPGLEQALKKVSILIYAEPEIEGAVTFALDPAFAFKELEAAGDIGVEAAYEPDLGICKARFYVGGKPGVTLHIPPPLIKQLRFKAYAGAEFEWKLITVGPFEYIFVDVTCPAKPKAEDKFVSLRIPAHDLAGLQLHPVDRSYLNDGLPRFVGHAYPSHGADSFLSLPSEAQNGSTLRVFQAMVPMDAGQTQSPQNVQQQEMSPAQVDLTLIENVFPDSEPALAGQGPNLMLLYVSDNGAAGDLQCTDINWMWYDGTEWTEPAAIATDTRAEFAPRVAFDGNGDVVAVWERIKDPNFNTVAITAMARQMEIVWSQWDTVARQWRTPVALTDNECLDHTPLVCGPMADGSLHAVWTQNEQSLLMGDSNSPDTLMWSRWDPALHAWSDPMALLSLSCRLSQSLSGTGLGAAYVWTQDMDGDLSDPNDQEVFICHWDAQLWGPVVRLTDNTVPDRNVRAAMAEPNGLYLVWQWAGGLVMSHNLAGATLVRDEPQTGGLADYMMTLGPSGNMVLLWEDQSETGPDAFYSVYDPVSDGWSRDNRLFTDSPLEKSFAPVWDDAGNLTVAFNRVHVSKTTKTVALDDGSLVTVDNVPTPGRADLSVLKRRLRRDLAFEEGGLSADARDYLPGSGVTLQAKFRNVGDLSANDVTVAFYDGDPSNGGEEIGRKTVSGWMDGGAEQQMEMTWLIPGPPMVHVLHAVIDPDHQIDDSDRTNNQFSLSIGGTDLEIRLIEAMGEADGSATIIVEVRNMGALGAPSNTLVLRDTAEPGVVIVTKVVPELASGQGIEIILDLPVGVLPAGDVCLTAKVDDANQIDDVDPGDNQVIFSIYVAAHSFTPEPNNASVPVARWQLDEGTGTVAGDSAGTNPGVVYGAQWVDGQIGGALNFDGKNDYVDCGNAEVLAPERMTLALWVFIEETASYQYILGKATNLSPSRDYALLTTGDGKLEFSFGESVSAQVLVRSSEALPVGQWVHMAATRDGSVASLYVNGRLERLLAYTFDVTDKGYGLRIGSIGSKDGWAGFFKGMIDDVCIYDEALSADEIQVLHEDASP